MKRPPLMFAVIVILVCLALLTILGFWNAIFPGPYLNTDAASP